MLIYLHQKYFFFLHFDPELPASVGFVLLLHNNLLTSDFFVKQISKQWCATCLPALRCPLLIISSLSLFTLNLQVITSFWTQGSSPCTNINFLVSHLRKTISMFSKHLKLIHHAIFSLQHIINSVYSALCCSGRTHSTLIIILHISNIAKLNTFSLTILADVSSAKAVPLDWIDGVGHLFRELSQIGHHDRHLFNQEAPK